MSEPKTKSVVVTPASQRIKKITMDEPKPPSISTERINAPSTPPRKRIKIEEPRMSIAVTNATTTTAAAAAAANESIVVTPSPPQTKRSTDDGDNIQQPLFALESFAALQANDPNWVHTLILGTMPSKKSFAENLSPKEIQLRGGSGRQIYGNSQNVFWNIVGSALGFQRHQTIFREQVQRLTDSGYAIWDVLSKATRRGNSSSACNLVGGTFVPTDLPGFLVDHPNLNRLVFASADSATRFCRKNVWGGWLATGEGRSPTNSDGTNNSAVPTFFWMRGRTLKNDTFQRTHAIFAKKSVEVVDGPLEAYTYSTQSVAYIDGRDHRLVEVVVLPSTSPANALARPPEKELHWHKQCFRLIEPPEGYSCPGCEHYRLQSWADGILNKDSNDCNSTKHWFQDCPYREDWKTFRRQQNEKKQSKKSYEIDPFSWYL